MNKRSEISTIADIYTHTSDEAEREAVVVLERAIFGDMSPICSHSGTGTEVVVGNQNG